MACGNRRYTQSHMGGDSNVWIVKPAATCRGVGVVLHRNLEAILVRGEQLQSRVVQKYVERPLLLRGAFKFDLRQWVLVTSWQPLVVWVYDAPYARLCSAPLNLSKLHQRGAHLCNHAVQKHEAAAARGSGGAASGAASGATSPWEAAGVEGNVLSRNATAAALAGRYGSGAWEATVAPKIEQVVVQTLRAAEGEVVPRRGSFELLGFDLILDDALDVWLMEVNLSPALNMRTPYLRAMIKHMLQGLLRLTVDATFGVPAGAAAGATAGGTGPSGAEAAAVNAWPRAGVMDPKNNGDRAGDRARQALADDDELGPPPQP
eukprot:g2230.t1